MFTFIIFVAKEKPSFPFTAFVFANHHNKLTLSPSTAEVVHYVNDSHIVICNGHNNSRVRWFNPKNDVILNKKGRVHVEHMGDGKHAHINIYTMIKTKLP